MSRKRAIDSKCRDCIYDPLDRGTWRQQVELCGCSDCPLYEYRPLPATSLEPSKNRVKTGLNSISEGEVAV